MSICTAAAAPWPPHCAYFSVHLASLQRHGSVSACTCVFFKMWKAYVYSRSVFWFQCLRGHFIFLYELHSFIVAFLFISMHPSARFCTIYHPLIFCCSHVLILQKREKQIYTIILHNPPFFLHKYSPQRKREMLFGHLSRCPYANVQRYKKNSNNLAIYISWTSALHATNVGGEFAWMSTIVGAVWTRSPWNMRFVAVQQRWRWRRGMNERKRRGEEGICYNQPFDKHSKSAIWGHWEWFEFTLAGLSLANMRR